MMLRYLLWTVLVLSFGWLYFWAIDPWIAERHEEVER